MRGRIDAKIERRRKDKKKSGRVPGGKALQRLFDYLGQRDPALADILVSERGVPDKLRPRFLRKRGKPQAAAAAAVTPRPPRGRLADPASCLRGA